MEPLMIMDTLRLVATVGATLTMGLVAGAFMLYAHTIMPGLRATDDRTFVAAFQALDRSIINPLFMVGGFVGALVLTLLAALANLHRPAFVWTVSAFVLYLIAVVLTIAVNVPLNNAIKAAGNPDRIGDLAAVRRAFNEPRWTASNLVRTTTTVAAFACLALSLIRQ